MKFTRGKYPDIPGRPEYDSPCWQLETRLIDLDIDWNTRFPFGACFGGHQHGTPPGKWKWSFCLDVNAPLGEPNRLYLSMPGWSVILGLLPGDGVVRYRYHQDENGKWVRNDKPEPWNWGWLAIERRNHAEVQPVQE